SFQSDRDAARAEGLAELLEAAGNARAAVLARAGIIERIAADVVPVAANHRLLARRAIGRTAGLVVDVAGIDIVEPGELCDLARARQRRGRRGRDVGHLPVGMEGGEVY